MVNKQYCRVHIRPDAPSPQGGQVCWCNEIRPHTRSLVAIWCTRAREHSRRLAKPFCLVGERSSENEGVHHPARLAGPVIYTFTHSIRWLLNFLIDRVPLTSENYECKFKDYHDYADNHRNRHVKRNFDFSRFFGREFMPF